ncbi:transposase [Streptacidiphilus sp. P02-A3a]|nr:transposase [Streptacidiphilus sp. P02-A3a]QMU73443.1 transposase [Streptacidiphilus sp. P02-A3a]
MRRKSGRKPGKQHGDPGATRCQVADPDEVIECPPPECGNCGTELADATVFRVSKRQVFEVAAPPPPLVTEYWVISKTCPCCGTVTVGSAPSGAGGRVQWGPGVKARAVLTVMAHHLPFGRAKRLLRDLAGIDCSTGWLVNVRRQAAAALEPFMAHIQKILHRARLLHVDETTVRAAAKLAYLHVACDDKFTAMHTGGRGVADIDAGKILDGFAGILVRDGYGGYTHLVDAVHVWCGAHTLRDLKAVHDADPGHQQGAEAMANTLALALKATHEARRSGTHRDPLPLRGRDRGNALGQHPWQYAAPAKGPDPGSPLRQAPRHDPGLHPRPDDPLHQQRSRVGSKRGEDPPASLRVLANPGRTRRLRRHLVIPVHRRETQHRPPRRPRPTVRRWTLAAAESRTNLTTTTRGAADPI